MDDAISSTIHLSYLLPPMPWTTHLLLLWIAWAVLIISWILDCIRAPTSELEERYSMIEHTLITKRASAPPFFPSKHHAQEHQQKCGVCQSPFQVNNLVSWSSNPQCCHVYHHMCIKRRLLKHSDCPLCRHSFAECKAASSLPSASYFCVRNGLQQTSHDNAPDERARYIPAGDLKHHRNHSIDVNLNAVDPWDSAELLQSYGRHMRLPPCSEKGIIIELIPLI